MARPKANTGSSPTDFIQQAIAQFDAQIAELTSQRDQLARMLPNAAPAAPRRGRPPGSAKASAKTAKSGRPRRKFSAATRKKLKEAAKARWAKAREERGQEAAE